MTDRQENLNFNETALRVLHDRYLWRDTKGVVFETPKQMLERVAFVVSKGDRRKERAYYEIMANLDFLPNSPTLMNAGREGVHGQLSACYVLDVPDSMAGIYDALKYQALIHKSGGGTGFNFSKLRAEGECVRSTNGRASGPLSFMELFDISTEKVMQGGMRRGANMAILNVNHPDIEKFICAKQEEGRFANFNFSVGMTDEFMEKIDRAGDNKETDLWRQIVNMAWRTGDPGIVFLDAIERGNTTPHLGKLDTTNPCGETPLYPNEACNLGSINLSNFYDNGRFRWERLAGVVRLAVRFLDDVIDVNHYPLPQIEEAVKRPRKIGLGVMGWADLLFKTGLSYSSPRAVAFGSSLMKYIYMEALDESRLMAGEKGSYPGIGKKDKPRRNATLTCIAPTGTLSLLAGCSSGIEPVFALSHTRRFKTKDGTEETFTYHHPEYQKALDDINDPRYNTDVFVTAHDISPEVHIRMQAAFQNYTELAVSKTINLPNHATREDVAKAYRLAWELGCKGTTIYRDGSKGTQVLYHHSKPDDGSTASVLGSTDFRPFTSNLECPECGGGVFVQQEGCGMCEDCGYSPCSL